MDSIRANRSKLVGRSQSKTYVMEALRANAINRTEAIDYSTDGREILNANGLEKCDVKAIIFKQLKEEHPPEEMLENMPDRLPVLTLSTLLLLIFLEI